MKIHAEVLKRLRSQRGWSQEQLAAAAKLDKQTVHRLESGIHGRTRPHTLRSLANALRVNLRVLTGEEAAPEAPASASPLDSTSELTVRIDNAARNALALAARRYRVSQARILEVAPLLFVWAAEASQRRRAERLGALEEQLGLIGGRASEFQHLSHLLTWNSNAEGIIAHERNSISDRDLFGAKIPFDDVAGPFLADEYLEEWDNPFACFLRDLANEAGQSFSGFDGHASPSYELCRAEAAEIVGGDDGATDAILSGHARLHEMPKDVRRGTAEARAQWTIAAARMRSEELERACPGLGDEIERLLSTAPGGEQ